MRALAKDEPVGMLHVDAHTDCCGEEMNSKYSHGTPEIGGILPIEAQRLIRRLRGLDIVGADLVEVSPPFDPSGYTALITATIMYEMLCIIADAKYS
jgi:arginase family enzyme